MKRQKRGAHDTYHDTHHATVGVVCGYTFEYLFGSRFGNVCGDKCDVILTIYLFLAFTLSLGACATSGDLSEQPTWYLCDDLKRTPSVSPFYKSHRDNLIKEINSRGENVCEEYFKDKSK